MRKLQSQRCMIQVEIAHFDNRFLQREVEGKRGDQLDTTKFKLDLKREGT